MKKIYLFLVLILSFGFSLNVFAAEGLSISPLRFEFEVGEGKSVTEKVRITNNSDKTITIYSSSEDFVSGDDSGTPKFIKAGDAEAGKVMLSNWIKIEQGNITLAPKETQEVLFTISVPQNVEPGGHYAAVFFGPGAPGGAQVAVVQRLGVLILVNIPGEVQISGDVTGFEIGNKDEKGVFTQNTKFKNLPIDFKTTFENTGNTHLKPKGKIILKDENGEILKNIGKETQSTPAGAYAGENMVDYLPINDTAGNVLPHSKRVFQNVWQGFGYSELNPKDGTRSVKFLSPEEYYKQKAREGIKSKFLMPWQQLKIKNVEKKITAIFELSYEGKDKVKKDFNDKKEFIVTYPEEYIGLNIYFTIFILILLGGGGYYFYVIYPKQKAKKEELLREKILKEMNKKDID